MGGHGPAHLVLGSRLVGQDVVDHILSGFGANRAIQWQVCMPATLGYFLANGAGALANGTKGTVPAPKVGPNEPHRPAHRQQTRKTRTRCMKNACDGGHNTSSL